MEPHAADLGRPLRPRGRGLIGGWLFTIAWLAICASAGVRMLSRETEPLGLAMLGVFLAAGLGMLVSVTRRTRLAGRHEGAGLTCEPPAPAGGGELRVRLRSRQALAAQGSVSLRLAEYRIDDRHSGARARMVRAQCGPAVIVGEGKAAFVQASFRLPPDAAANGARRDGEQVSWRLEWLDSAGQPELSFDLDVRAGPDAAAVLEDRWAARTVERHGAAASSAAPDPPEVVAFHEDAVAVEWRFGRRHWQLLAVCTGLAALTAFSMAWYRAAHGGDADAKLGLWALSAVLLALAGHAGTLRWRLRVDDDGICVDRSSWLWPRVRCLPWAALGQIETAMTSTVSSGDQGTEFHCVQIALQAGEPCPLTPGLATREAADRLARRLMQVPRDRGARFAPGQVRRRPGRKPADRVVPLLAWCAWAALVGLAARALVS